MAVIAKEEERLFANNSSSPLQNNNYTSNSVAVEDNCDDEVQPHRRTTQGRGSCKDLFKFFSFANSSEPSSVSYMLEEETSVFTSDSDSGSESFLSIFISSRGPPQIVFLLVLFALAVGSTIGVVPSVVTDRYARLNHGFDPDRTGTSCSDYGMGHKPQQCLDGSSDAQSAAAASSFLSNMLTFITSSLVGSISDEYGRRRILLLAQCLSLIPPLFLVLLQLIDSMSPTWYYAANVTGGFISWITIALSSISDVMPKKWRAPCFGILLSGFATGFAFSPSLALAFTHFGISVASLCVLIGSILFTLFFLPETLPRRVAEEARRRRERQELNTSRMEHFVRSVLRPMRELLILNRDSFFRLLSALAFFSGMTSSGDQTFLLFYVEDRFGFKDSDIAMVFLIFGFFGIFVQGFLLKQMIDIVGERYVIVVAFIFGAIHSAMYAFAPSKLIIFLAVMMGTLTAMAFPTISAIKSYNVEEHEQGRIQGALYALSSLASAFGPIIFRLLYQKSKDTTYPGSFFLVGTLFYLVATICALLLCKDRANSKDVARNEIIQTDEVLHQINFEENLL